MTIGSTIRVSSSNKSGKASITRSFYKVADIQVEIPKTVLKETASYAIARIPKKVFAIKKLKKFVNATANTNNFEIDLNYSPKQDIIKLFDFDKKSSFNMHRSKVNSLYIVTPHLKIR